MRLITLVLFLCPAALMAQPITWDAPIIVNSNIDLGNTRPKIALTKGGVPVVMWGRATNREVYVSRGTENGFSQPVVVTPQGMNAFVQSWAGPSLDVRDDTVFVAFKLQPDQEEYVYVVRSVDGGRTFDDTMRVSSNNWSRFPEVSILPGGNPVVTYMEFEPNFLDPHYAVCVSEDGGLNFSDPVSASGVAPGESCDCCPGFILAERDQIVMMFRNNDNDLRDIWASISTDGGKTFSFGKDIDENNWMIGGCPSTGPEAITVGDSLVAVWMSGASGKSKINVGTADLKALNVGINSEITPATDNQQNYPKIAGDDLFVIATWQEIENGSRNIKSVWSTQGAQGLIGKSSFQVNANANGIQQSPDVAYANGFIHLVWQDVSARKVMYRRARIDLASASKRATNKPFITLTPNPTSDQMYVYTENKLTTPIDVVIYTSLGQPKLKATREVRSFTLDISHLNPGFYTVEVSYNEEVRIKKILVQ